MNSAKALNDKQRRYDKLHHLSRLAWLGAPVPKWCNGDPIQRWMVLELTKGSEECLRIIETGMSVGSVDLNDSEYLRFLDGIAMDENKAA